MKREYLLHSKISRGLFALVSIVSLVLAFWNGQLHHMLIALACGIMYLALLPDKSLEKDTK